MVQFNERDVIPVSDFAFAWRITDPKWTSLPEPVLRRIKPLAVGRSQQIFERSGLLTRQGVAFDADRYHPAANFSLEGSEPAKSRFRTLPVADREQVYMCWLVADGVAAVVLDWATFTEIWDDLWYPFDQACVFDESLAWALLLGPEEHAVFIQQGPVTSHLANTDPTYGMSVPYPVHAKSGG